MVGGHRLQVCCTPGVGQRMFPLLPSSKAWNCDIPLSVSWISEQYGYDVHVSAYSDWDAGINAVSHGNIRADSN
ncbi:hypothetical protein P4H39_05060 [Paenibacillus lautus]|uniref:hypothetical protein n=1 Tax=Paenibacillus lautus TaxID=1401 RepID=UPI002DB82D6E|nr:hypothetical protein [Paenibacillus lautus]MEC0201992.1 hypothetical protein [Paenibacillus lautus]